ncbi:MAG: heat shock protein HspQ [Alphaproteobacteria bacterium]|nr:heat shock protein HspQ [Alphaproteobacteria bacterium]
MKKSFARFHVGQPIHHKLFDYRGVIVDVDASYQGSAEWYERVARSKPPKDAPWYHVLVDGADHWTYVAERNLEEDHSGEPIDHPDLGEIFKNYSGGQYNRRQGLN